VAGCVFPRSSFVCVHLTTVLRPHRSLADLSTEVAGRIVELLHNKGKLTSSTLRYGSQAPALLAAHEAPDTMHLRWFSSVHGLQYPCFIDDSAQQSRLKIQQLALQPAQ
jgi:hypothetical protein